MAISHRVIDILCCPSTKVPVKPAPKELLKGINSQIAVGAVRYMDDTLVKEQLQEALVTDNFSTVYRIDDGIPVMLEEQGIALQQQSLHEIHEKMTQGRR